MHLFFKPTHIPTEEMTEEEKEKRTRELASAFICHNHHPTNYKQFVITHQLQMLKACAIEWKKKVAALQAEGCIHLMMIP